MEIPFLDYGGSGLPLTFLHANGYPPACYDPLLGRLKDHYHVVGLLLRPLWPGTVPADIRDWHPLSNDLLDFLADKKIDRTIAVGHSLGATVALRSALRDPGRFQALVLLEPVIFPYYFMLEWNLFRALGLGHRLHPKIRGAINRRREFDDLEQVFIGYRRRPVFRYMSDDDLRIFIKGMTRAKRPPAEGFELAYSPEWEAQIYYSGLWNDWDLWRGIPRLAVPTLILRGSETDTFWESTGRSIGKRNPGIKVVTVDRSTHLLPLEKPQQVFNLIQTFLKENPG